MSLAVFNGLRRATVALSALLLVTPFAHADEYGPIAERVAFLLEQEHYNDQRIDDSVSHELLDNYLDFLDLGRVYFLKSDIDGIRAKYDKALDDRLLAKDISPAFDIYGIYKQRVMERVERIKKMLDSEEFKFDSTRSVEFTRKDSPWPADQAAADQLWHNIVEGELLQEELRMEAKAANKEAGKPVDPLQEEDDEKNEGKTPKEIVAKRYDRILDSLLDNTGEDIASFYLKSLAHAYDPHSDYFTQSEYENFMIQMKKNLTGIGALLSMTDSGYAEIKGLVVGGPAHKAGELQVNDRIVEVGQGLKGSMEDIKHMKLQKVVDLIRGEKGSHVRLKVIPADAVDPSETKIIQIKREEVDLKESLARAELIETKNAEGRALKLGWIDIPSFYSDMQNGSTSVTKDVERLLNRLQKEGIEGLVLDLRENGGGSLEEAINLTGLFISRGPVVQAKDSRNERDVKFSTGKEPLYKGPLVVLTTKASASASEILAAALQDYNRAIIVGERSTFGKGTVQQLLPVTTNQLAVLLPQAQGNQAGALKLTIQKFYRIAGGSTQQKGVIPDIILPSVTDAMEIGEASLKHPLPYDEIAQQRFALFRQTPLPLNELSVRSSQRVKADPDFQWIQSETERFRDRKAKNAISLNKETRKQEVDEQEVRNEARQTELKARYAKIKQAEAGLFKTYSLTLDRVNVPALKPMEEVTAEELSGMKSEGAGPKTEEQKALESPHGYGSVKRETISILMDFIDTERRGANPANTLTISQSPEKTVPAN